MSFCANPFRANRPTNKRSGHHSTDTFLGVAAPFYSEVATGPCSACIAWSLFRTPIQVNNNGRQAASTIRPLTPSLPQREST